MLRYLLAVAIALSLAGARPALACPNCDKCPHKVAAADDKKPVAGDKAPKDAADCGCTGPKDCKCGKDCRCSNCRAQKQKKDEKAGTKS